MSLGVIASLKHFRDVFDPRILSFVSWMFRDIILSVPWSSYLEGLEVFSGPLFMMLSPLVVCTLSVTDLSSGHSEYFSNSIVEAFPHDELSVV